MHVNARLSGEEGTKPSDSSKRRFTSAATEILVSPGVSCFDSS
jgi:hypothetical protein